MTGLNISSFHGRYEAQSSQSFLIDSVQNDERLRCDYPLPTPLSELPALDFRLTFYEGGIPGSGRLFFQDYTLGGPRNAARLLPAMRVVTDGGQRYDYGSDGPGVRQAARIDSETGVAEAVVFTPIEEDLGWEMGTAFDSKRQRILLVTLGGAGFLYSLAQNETEWARLAGMNNLDVDCLEYHAPGDALYGVRISHADDGAASVYEFSPAGALRREIRLAVLPFDIAPARHRSELVSVGEYLVLLLEPEYSFSSEPHEARIYLIDPRTSQVWLTYRIVSPPDSDADGVPDDRDRCPHTAPGVTVDANGCSADQRDSDGDGIADSRDLCPNTAPGTIINREGCGIVQLCPCDGPWGSHAEYVRCVIQRAWEFYRQDLITPDDRRQIERDAVMSDCGRLEGESELVCLNLLPLTAEECQRDGVQFILSGDASGGCVIECSTDLVHWAPVETQSQAIAGEEAVCPARDGLSACFYRVRLTP